MALLSQQVAPLGWRYCLPFPVHCRRETTKGESHSWLPATHPFRPIKYREIYMYKVQGNRLRFLGHQGPLPLMSPGGLDPSDTIMSTSVTITSTRKHRCPSLNRRPAVLSTSTSIWLVPYQNLKDVLTSSQRRTVSLAGWKPFPSGKLTRKR